MQHAFVYLASQSPRRAQLLDQIGVRHHPLLPGPDEDAEALEAERSGESPDDYVRRVTLAKLGAARERLRRRGLPAAPVLCADTTVTIDGAILGKPADAGQALAMLRRLSGRTHRVVTAVAVGSPAWPGLDGVPSAWREVGGARPTAGQGDDAGPPALAVSVSHVRFAPVAERDLAHYVAGGEPFGKAGAYAIQSAAAAWIAHIDGSYSGIMGLPLHETALLLRAAGVVV